MNTSDIIILGGGPAGLRLAKLLSAKGLDTVLIEKDLIGARSRSWISWEDDITKYGYKDAIKNRISGLKFRSFLGGEHLFMGSASAIAAPA